LIDVDNLLCIKKAARHVGSSKEHGNGTVVREIEHFKGHITASSRVLWVPKYLSKHHDLEHVEAVHER
jgi:hypothetical protein